VQCSKRPMLDPMKKRSRTWVAEGTTRHFRRRNSEGIQISNLLAYQWEDHSDSDVMGETEQVIFTSVFRDWAPLELGPTYTPGRIYSFSVG
jgi:hypothetical protein